MFRASSRLFCAHRPISSSHSFSFPHLRSVSSHHEAGLPPPLDPLGLVGMMKDTRNRERAEELMRIAKSKNAATKPLYDSYLACLADLKLTKMVKDGLATMIASKITPDEKSYSALLKAHLETGSHFQEIEKIMEKLQKNNQMGDHGYHVVIRYYCKTGNLDIAMRFYHKMLRLHLIPSHLIYNDLIAAHGRTAEGCKGMFDEMRKRGVEPTEETYEILSKLYMNDAHTCRGLHAGMEKRGIKMNAKIAANMITAFGIAKEWTWCKKVWAEVLDAERRPRIETYLAMLSYYTASGDNATIMQVLSSLKQSNLVSQEFVYTSMISVLAQAGEYTQCAQVHSSMAKEGLEPSPEVFESLVIGYARLKESRTAISFEMKLRERKEKTQPPTTDNNNNNNNNDNNNNNNSNNDKHVMGRTAYHSLLNSCAQGGDTWNVARLLTAMRVEAIPPTPDSYWCLFEGAQGNNGAVHAMRWYREMEEECENVSNDVYLSALRACSRDSKSCLEIFDRMKMVNNNSNTRVNDEAYDIVLFACASSGNLAACKSILEDVKRLKISLEKTTYNKLMEGYGKLGDLPECRAIAGQMKEKEMELDNNARAAIRPLSSGGTLFNTLVDEMDEVEEGKAVK